MRRAAGVATLIISAVLVGVAVANRHTVVLYLDPLRDPGRSVEVPVYAALLAALALGVLLGGVATRLSGRRRVLSRTGPARGAPSASPLPERPLLTHRKSDRLLT
ncbi:DUF1049 domain-containing protein [Acuticoccus sediminis]|uniref:DUF1049 domain-containing protein n=1 Tax=Acuticoccus sediminis TaxID=2184697 RepID=UPI000DAC748E|nr:DUF1049 domain-containing protein [Acuticoccus sediminis]